MANRNRFATLIFSVNDFLCQRLFCTGLPNQFQRKLDFPVRDLRSAKGAEACRCNAGGVQRFQVAGVGGCEVRVIQNVEELSAELDVEVFREPLDVGVLNNREIDIEQPWADNRVASQVAK